MDINFEYYKIFYYVAKYKNITRAAAALGSNQPNVTRIMKLLEEGLHCKLLVREARGVMLTEAGERLYAHVETAFHQLLKAQEEIGFQMLDGTGSVEIGATETALHLFLLDVLRTFKEVYPKVRIRIHNHTTPEILRSLVYGKLDLAVITTPFETSGHLESRRLIGFQEILAGGAQYRMLRCGKSGLEEVSSGKQDSTQICLGEAEHARVDLENITWERQGAERLQHEKAVHIPWNLQDLKVYPWVGIGAGTATCELYREYFFRQNMNIEPDTEVATSDLLIPLIRAGMGIGFVPEQMAQPYLEEGELVRIPLTCELPKREIRLVYDSGRGMSAAAEVLRKYLQDQARNEKKGIQR